MEPKGITLEIHEENGAYNPKKVPIDLAEETEFEKNDEAENEKDEKEARSPRVSNSNTKWL